MFLAPRSTSTVERRQFTDVLECQGNGAILLTDCPFCNLSHAFINSVWCIAINSIASRRARCGRYPSEIVFGAMSKDASNSP